MIACSHAVGVAPGTRVKWTEYNDDGTKREVRGEVVEIDAIGVHARADDGGVASIIHCNVERIYDDGEAAA